MPNESNALTGVNEVGNKNAGYAQRHLIEGKHYYLQRERLPPSSTPIVAGRHFKDNPVSLRGEISDASHKPVALTVDGRLRAAYEPEVRKNETNCGGYPHIECQDGLPKDIISRLEQVQKSNCDAAVMRQKSEGAANDMSTARLSLRESQLSSRQPSVGLIRTGSEHAVRDGGGGDSARKGTREATPNKGCGGE